MNENQGAEALPDVRFPIFSSWKSVALGDGYATVSPIRDYTLICTDPECPHHLDDGNPEPYHRPLKRSTQLEDSIIVVFRNITTDYEHECLNNHFFRGWTVSDLRIACEDSGSVTHVNEAFFGSDHNERLLNNIVDHITNPDAIPHDRRRDVRYNLYTWRRIARENGPGKATVSPLRDYTLICTDPFCELHESYSGDPLPQHRPLMRATTQEMMIIMSFYHFRHDDYDNEVIRNPHLLDWSANDLRIACEQSDNITTVNHTFFGNLANEEKMEVMTRLFSGRPQMLIEMHHHQGPGESWTKRDIFADLTLAENDRARERGERGAPFHEFIHVVVTKLLLEYTQNRYHEIDDYIENREELRSGRPYFED